MTDHLGSVRLVINATTGKVATRTQLLDAKRRPYLEEGGAPIASWPTT